MIEEIKKLHRLHSITKDFSHIIEYKTGSWKMFEPSRFIYSFFTFNSLYEINWSDSIADNTIYYEFDNDPEKTKESTKMRAYINFIFEYATEDDFKILSQNIKKMGKGKKPLENNELHNLLQEIVLDDRIKNSDKNDFIVKIEKLVSGRKLTPSQYFNSIVKFIYYVRNNIFHGSKTTIEMAEKKQRDRLIVYSNILNQTNELFFKIISREVQFLEMNKKYKLNFDD